MDNNRKNVEILMKTKDFLVVYKPAGMPVQTNSATRMDLEHYLLNLLSLEKADPHAGQKEILGGRRQELYVIHRLDQPVEGILVFARNQKTAAELGRQLEDGRMKKQYLAVVCGNPEEEAKLSDYLLRDGRTNTSRVADPSEKGAKQAQLIYRCLLRTGDGRALLKIDLLTGRHHQIRVQLAAAGLPILGDRKYGQQENETFTEGKTENMAAYPALCAASLTFSHPKTGKQLSFQMEPQNPAFPEMKKGESAG